MWKKKGCSCSWAALVIPGVGLTWLRVQALLKSPSSHLIPLSLGLEGPVQMVTGPVSIPGRYWETVERLKINHFYGAPTAIRLLLRYGDEWVKKYDRSSLKVLGSGNCWWCGLEQHIPEHQVLPLPTNAKSNSIRE